MSRNHLTIAVVALMGAASAMGNLLQNGDFALDGTTAQFGTAVLNNWTTWGTSGYYNNDMGADLSVKFWWDDAGMYQDWACVGGQEYLLSVDARQRTAEPLTGWQGYMKVEFYDSGNNQLAAQELGYFNPEYATDTWVQVSGSYTAPENSAYGRTVIGLKDYGDGSGGSVYFDNASVLEAIPEPVSAMLLGTGLMGLWAARRRSRR